MFRDVGEDQHVERLGLRQIIAGFASNQGKLWKLLLTGFNCRRVVVDADALRGIDGRQHLATIAADFEHSVLTLDAALEEAVWRFPVEVQLCGILDREAVRHPSEVEHDVGLPGAAERQVAIDLVDQRREQVTRLPAL